MYDSFAHAANMLFHAWENEEKKDAEKQVEATNCNNMKKELQKTKSEEGRNAKRECKNEEKAQ